jgi:hypothetical protein
MNISAAGFPAEVSELAAANLQTARHQYQSKIIQIMQSALRRERRGI